MDATQLTLDTTPARAVQRLMEDLGLSRREMAEALDATPWTLERWRSGLAHPQVETRRRLAALLALDERLGETFADRDAVREWIATPGRYLGGLTPAEAVRVGRMDRVEAALEALDSGVFL